MIKSSLILFRHHLIKFPKQHFFYRLVFSLHYHFMKIAFLFGSIRKQECIPVGCVPPACCPYLPACTAPGGVPARGCTCPGGYLPGGCTCLGGTCPGTPLEQNSWHTLLKILPCPKLRLRVVISLFCRQASVIACHCWNCLQESCLAALGPIHLDGLVDLPRKTQIFMYIFNLNLNVIKM